jgi:hypothetical protein
MKTILSALLLLTSTFLIAQDGQVNFSEQFKKENNGKYKIEIDEYSYSNKVFG